MTNLSLTDFQKMFSPNIRAMLNWELLKAENVSIETRVIASEEDLGALFTVWHVNSKGHFADWDNPITVGESFAPEIHWDDKRTTNVLKFQHDYSTSSEPVNLLLPVYAAGEKLVLLDSTHRTVAVNYGRLPFTAMLVILHGPVSEQVLPDLRWHANNP